MLRRTASAAAQCGSWRRVPAGVSAASRPAPARTAISVSTAAALPLLPRRAFVGGAVAGCRVPARLSCRARGRDAVPLTVRRLSDKTSSSSPTPPGSAAPAARENIYTVPNMLTAARLAAAPFIGYCILHDMPGTALSLLVAAGVSDLLDGWIARRWHLRTVVGSVIDPMADKVLMTVLVVSLAADGALPLWLAALVLGRDAGLAVSAVYYRYISLPPPKTLARYWDFSLPSAEVRPTTISKYNTFLQLALMAATTAAPVVAAPAVSAVLGGPYDLAPALTALQYVVAVTTVWSGLSYVVSKDAVKILTQNRPKK